jgi:hypothetical protein
MNIQKILNKVLTKYKYKFNYYDSLTSLSQISSIIISDTEKLQFSSYEIEVLSDKGLTRSNKRLKYHLGYEADEVRYGVLSNAEVFGNSGACVFENKLIIDSYNFDDRIISSPTYKNIQIRKKINKKGLYFSLFSMPYAQNPYHLIIEDLPKLYLLKLIQEPINIIIPEKINKKYKELVSIAIKQFPHANEVIISEDENWIVDKLLLVSNITQQNSAYLRNPYLSFTQDLLRTILNIENSQTKSKKLYISREKANKRKLLNEECLRQQLIPLGFSILNLEDISIKDQLMAFSEASIIVGPHGAGLHNIVLSNNCKLVEIQSSDNIKTHYMFLVKALKGEYYLIKGSQSDCNQNYFVDTSNVLKVINSL